MLIKMPLGTFSAYLQQRIKGNAVLQYWLLSYIDMSLSGFLQTGWLSVSSFPETFNALIGVLISTLAVISPFCILYVTLSKHTGAGWSPLFSEFHCKSVPGSLFYSLFLFRRLVFALALIFASSWPQLQSTTFSSLSLSVNSTQNLIYLLYFRPYTDPLHAISAVLYETSMALLCIPLIFYSFSGEWEAVGTFGKWIVYISLGISAGLSIIEVTRSAVKGVRRWNIERKEKKKARLSAVNPTIR